MSLRLKPSDVLAAYEVTGLRPLRGGVRQYTEKTRKLEAGCALCAVWFTGGPNETTELVTDWARERYGEEYVRGFMMGWDKGGDTRPDLDRKPDFLNGIVDGSRAWNRIAS